MQGAEALENTGVSPFDFDVATPAIERAADTLDLLLDCHFDVDVQDCDGNTVLHLALTPLHANFLGNEAPACLLLERSLFRGFVICRWHNYKHLCLRLTPVVYMPLLTLSLSLLISCIFVSAV